MNRCRKHKKRMFDMDVLKDWYANTADGYCASVLQVIPISDVTEGCFILEWLGREYTFHIKVSAIIRRTSQQTGYSQVCRDEIQLAECFCMECL